MSRVWLTSYPKSGNTWFRMLIASLSATPDQPLDINNPPESQPMISQRDMVDDATLVDTSLLTHDEAEVLRARVYPEALSMHEVPGPLPHFYKVHDAYVRTPAGDPVFGRGAADAVILIVRDPRDVAVSMSAHFAWDVESAIAFMGRDDASLFGAVHDRHRQFRQRLLSWSAHAASWLDQDDLPVHVVRYEELQADTAGAFREAMTFAGRRIAAADADRAAALASFTNLQAQERKQGFSEGPARGHFFRRGQSGGWHDALTADQAARIEGDHAGMMRRLSYAPDQPGSVAPEATLWHHLPLPRSRACQKNQRETTK